MKRVAALAGVAALGGPATAGAQEHGGHEERAAHVAIHFLAFGPTHVDVLARDSVTWANESVRRHDVTADDGSWTSGGLFAGGMYERAFATPDSVAYHCSIHPSMRGSIGVHELLLAAPAEPGAPGRPFALRGRTALSGGTPIAIEADYGKGFTAVASAAAGADGAFTATLRPAASAQLRAVAGSSVSPPVTLLVLDRKVTASARTRRGGVAVVRTKVLPASAKATVVLQLRLRERFGWWPVRRARLDHHSRARFRVHLRRAVRARVVLTLADGATPLAVSRTLRVGRRH